MMRLLKILTFILCLSSTLSCIYDGPVTKEDIKVGDIIPDFSVEMYDGTTMTGEYLRKGVSVIMFFHTDCPDCAATLPEVQKIYDEYFPQQVKFAVISREEGKETIDHFWKANSLTLPYSARSDRTVYNLFADSRIPRVYICLDGIIKAVFTDEPNNPTSEDIRSVLEGLI